MTKKENIQTKNLKGITSRYYHGNGKNDTETKDSFFSKNR